MTISLFLSLSVFSPLWTDLYTTQQESALAKVKQMLEQEHDAALHKPLFTYISIERSDRTEGHEWTERVVEVPEGKLRYLISEDGRPLSADRRNREDARLRSIAKDPRAFIRHEHTQKSEEQRAQQVLDLLPRGFLFQDCGIQQGWEKITYRPNPSYIPETYEERIVHEMSGTLLIDPHTSRLHEIDGKLAQDVSFGYGLIATLRAGSSFSLTRNAVVDGLWKTTELDIQMNGHVVLFKTISRQQNSIHKEFKLLPSDINIAQAALLVTR